MQCMDSLISSFSSIGRTRIIWYKFLETDFNTVKNDLKDCPKRELEQTSSSSLEASKEPGFGINSERSSYSLDLCQAGSLETDFN